MAIRPERINRFIPMQVYVYPDGEVYEQAVDWKSDDYEIREQGYCAHCDSDIVPHYNEPFASCDCCTQEWYQ